MERALEQAVADLNLEVELYLNIVFHAYVLEDEDRTGGPPIVELDKIHVPAWRAGRGLGTTALRAFVQFGKIHRVTLLVRPAKRGDFDGETTSRARLVRFYRRYGFSEIVSLGAAKRVVLRT
jgi:ribosomal protein S18 acetylase RimI-like enzyme